MAELRTYQNCCIMSILSYDPFRRYICSYLWFSDIFSLSLTCKELYDYLMLSDSVFATEMFNQLLSKSHRNIQTVHQKLTPIWNNKIMFAYAARLTQWPNKMQLTRRINYDILELDTVEGSVGNCYCYQGKHKGKNRSFVGNDHFPVPLPTSNLPEWMEVFRPYGSLPFTKIVTNPSNSKSVPVLSFIAYFEIKIHSPQVPSNAIPPRNNHKPCICIGISRPGFDIYKKMPGWDSNSYGFHSDDGMFFCGDASRGYRSTLNSEQNTFGVGDTVGFGIVYPSSCHFEDGTVTFEGDDHGAFLFTKNGVLQASLCIQDENFFHYSWFPTIGTDAYNPIEMNFGNKGVPFVFDIVSFERGLDCKFSCESIRQTFLPEFSENECFIRTLGRIRNKWSIFSLEKPIDFRYPLFKNFWVPWRDTENNYMDGEQFHNQAFKLTTQNQVRNESWLEHDDVPEELFNLNGNLQSGLTPNQIIQFIARDFELNIIDDDDVDSDEEGYDDDDDFDDEEDDEDFDEEDYEDELLNEEEMIEIANEEEYEEDSNDLDEESEEIEDDLSEQDEIDSEQNERII